MLYTAYGPLVKLKLTLASPTGELPIWPGPVNVPQSLGPDAVNILTSLAQAAGPLFVGSQQHVIIPGLVAPLTTVFTFVPNSSLGTTGLAIGSLASPAFAFNVRAFWTIRWSNPVAGPGLDLDLVARYTFNVTNAQNEQPFGSC